MHFPFLQDILVLLVFSVGIVFLLQRVRLPSILGFLITGVIIGPYGLSLVKAVDQVEIIAEIGVILLLFVIGLELSIKQLISMKKTVFVGGFLQVGLSIIAAGAAYYSFGFTWNESLFVGFLVSLSSTAIVLKVLQDNNEMSSSHGRNALAILIFQDIIVVPMMLFTPIIGGESENVVESIAILALKSAIVLGITVISARYVVPKLMYAIARTKSKELFLLTTITICFAVAFLTSEAGLSLALGAFLAGLIISESEYSHQATSIILPFRELFTSFFFISVGMLLNLAFFFEHFFLIMAAVIGVFILKTITASLSMAFLRYPIKTVLLTGLSLFQIGEFAFILSTVGQSYGLIGKQTYQYFLAISIVTMLLTPFVIMYSYRFVDWLISKKLFRALANMKSDQALHEHVQDSEHMSNHLVIVGYGVNGSNLAKAAMYGNIPYIVVELDANIVKQEKLKNVPIIYGDATKDHILEAVCLSKARTVVIAISDPIATKAIVSTVRTLSPTVYTLVRTRYVKETEELIALGADEVIPEEFETSVEIFSRVLHNFLVPEEDIVEFVHSMRADNYNLLQSQAKVRGTFRPPNLPDFSITCLRITKDSGKLFGQSLAELNFRTKYGINILAISRNDVLIQNIRPEEKLKPGDILLVNGDKENINQLYKQIH